MYGLLALACVVLAAPATMAAATTQATMSMHGNSLMHVYMMQGSQAAFNFLDLNNDGNLTRKELETYFDHLDSDGDGQMDLDEFVKSTSMQYGMAQREFEQLDLDKDGDLTRAEINTLYRKFDTNDDGLVTEKDFRNSYGRIMDLVHNAPSVG